MTTAGSAAPRDGAVIDLWPSTPPGSGGVRPIPTIIERSTDPFRCDRVLIGVDRPSLTVVAPRRPNGVSVIVAPGGGYAKIMLDKEGMDLARGLFLPLGITVFLMTYRLPGEGHPAGPDAPIQDGRRAMRVVRANAAAWGLDPGRIGFVGASAAGHIGAFLVADPTREVYAPVDASDAVSPRPDFAVLLYPVVTMDPAFAHAGSRDRLLGPDPGDEAARRHSPDLHVRPGAPEVFMVLADDDRAVPAENAIRFHRALSAVGWRCETHIFRDGGHGFSIDPAGGRPVDGWPELARRWLERIGVV